MIVKYKLISQKNSLVDFLLGITRCPIKPKDNDSLLDLDTQNPSINTITLER